MDFHSRLKQMLKLDEGCRRYPYDDGTGLPVKAPQGNLTVGIGRNLEAHPLSDDEIDLLFRHDCERAFEAAIDIFLDFERIDEVRQLAILNMLFNLGESRFRKFSKMIWAIGDRDWELAAHEAQDSAWYKQVGDRAIRVVKMLRTGEFQY